MVYSCSITKKLRAESFDYVLRVIMKNVNIYKCRWNFTVPAFSVNKRPNPSTIKFYFGFNLLNIILKYNSYTRLNQSEPNIFKSLETCVKCGVYACISC